MDFLAQKHDLVDQIGAEGSRAHSAPSRLNNATQISETLAAGGAPYGVSAELENGSLLEARPNEECAPFVAENHLCEAPHGEKDVETLCDALAEVEKDSTTCERSALMEKEMPYDPMRGSLRLC
ncbi:putative condensin-2 complex subunit D3 isoform X1 [Sesbania bispinosa]|nr:putative condensin-2 complex subunit D3 isoform X1 [Sesbania bispinosa]